VSDTIGPSYRRVADDLRSKITSGELAIDSPIPSTTKLMEAYDVSKTVIRRAVADLIAEHILIGHPGKAVYVKAKPEDVEHERVTVTDLHEEVTALREELRELAEGANLSTSLDDMAAELTEIRGIVGLLQVHLRHLYDRVGQPYPDNNHATAEPAERHRHKTS